MKKKMIIEILRNEWEMSKLMLKEFPDCNHLHGREEEGKHLLFRIGEEDYVNNSNCK